MEQRVSRDTSSRPTGTQLISDIHGQQVICIVPTAQGITGNRKSSTKQTWEFELWLTLISYVTLSKLVSNYKHISLL